MILIFTLKNISSNLWLSKRNPIAAFSYYLYLLYLTIFFHERELQQYENHQIL